MEVLQCWIWNECIPVSRNPCINTKWLLPQQQTQHITWSNNQELQVAESIPLFQWDEGPWTQGRTGPKVVWKYRGPARVTQISCLWARALFIEAVMTSPRKQVQILIFLIKRPDGCTTHAYTSSGILGGWHSSPSDFNFFFFPFARWLLLRANIPFPKSEHCQKGFWKLPWYLSGARWFAAVNQCS